MTTNKQVLLASRPNGWVKESDFRIVERPLAGPATARCSSATSSSRSIPICAGG